MSESFRAAWLRDLASRQPTAVRRDPLRFPWRANIRTAITDHLRVAFTRVAKQRRHVLLHETAFAQLATVLDHADEFDATYRGWADEASRMWMLALLSYSVLGRGLVRLPRDSQAYWDGIEQSQRPPLLRERAVAAAPHLGTLNRYVVEIHDTAIDLHAHPLNILATFLLEQYRFERDEVIIQPAAGDVVLDCGGCWGDTALWAAAQVGPEGMVHSFEFVPANLGVFERNLRANAQLAARINLARSPVWRHSNKEVAVPECGPATSLRRTSGSDLVTARTISIDDYVLTSSVGRVDFIKMDIEGAELAALEGAKLTIARDRPKCAIALYHQLDDWATIPEYFRELGGYELYLDHFSNHSEETILFARPSAPL